MMIVRRAFIRALVTAGVLIALVVATFAAIDGFGSPDRGIELLKATVKDLDAGPRICLMSDCRSLERDVVACLMARKAPIRAEAHDCEPRRLEIRLVDPPTSLRAGWPTRVGGPV